MTKFFLLVAAVLAVSNAKAAPAAPSCSIDPAQVFCPGTSFPGFDGGCSVTCETSQQAQCQPAFGIAFPSPNGQTGQCEVTLSFCYCR